MPLKSFIWLLTAGPQCTSHCHKCPCTKFDLESTSVWGMIGLEGSDNIPVKPLGYQLVGWEFNSQHCYPDTVMALSKSLNCLCSKHNILADPVLWVRISEEKDNKMLETGMLKTSVVSLHPEMVGGAFQVSQWEILCGWELSRSLAVKDLLI